MRIIKYNPSNNKVVYDKPVFSHVVTRSGNLLVTSKIDRFYPVSISAGQSMGLLLSLTYPVGFTVQSSKSN